MLGKGLELEVALIGAVINGGETNIKEAVTNIEEVAKNIEEATKNSGEATPNLQDTVVGKRFRFRLGV
ncbi:MAG: hypothetical protein P4L69_21225 [Desulfosporosinus sp.]|nr:hypothetical protein [Desulfosporosinus sp.]